MKALDAIFAKNGAISVLSDTHLSNRNIVSYGSERQPGACSWFQILLHPLPPPSDWRTSPQQPSALARRDQCPVNAHGSLHLEPLMSAAVCVPRCVVTGWRSQKTNRAQENLSVLYTSGGIGSKSTCLEAKHHKDVQRTTKDSCLPTDTRSPAANPPCLTHATHPHTL